MDAIRITGPSCPKLLQLLRLLHLLLFFYFLQTQSHNVIRGANGQAIVESENARPVVGNHISSSILSSFLEPCEILTLETQCSEEEYENNEDCLPQKTDNCDHSKELFCLSGVCLPNCHPHKDSYDHIEGKCFRKVGSDCKSSIGLTRSTNTRSEPEQTTTSSSHTSSKSNQDEPLTTVIVPPCEKNSVCERGQCRCAKDFTYDHNFNKCLLFAPYSGYCNETVNCDRKSDIECRENECQCKSLETQYFHVKRKRCYILIGQVCSSGLQFCPDNSNCVKAHSIISSIGGNDSLFSPTSTSTSFTKGQSNGERYYRLRQLYQEFALNQKQDEAGDDDEHFIGILGEDVEKEFVCKCDKNYGPTRDKRFCLGLLGARCNTLHRCNGERGLKCSDGTCVCDRENEQVYSEQFQTCITVIGASCLSDGKGEREEDLCPIGASCTDGKCVCDDGLMPSTLPKQITSSVAFSCMKSHGMRCKTENNSVDLFEPKCNHEVGLECNVQHEKCFCKSSSQFYDETERKCKNFQATNKKIPVIHFTPPDDREYTFRKNECTHIHNCLYQTLTVFISIFIVNIIDFY